MYCCYIAVTRFFWFFLNAACIYAVEVGNGSLIGIMVGTLKWGPGHGSHPRRDVGFLSLEWHLLLDLASFLAWCKSDQSLHFLRVNMGGWIEDVVASACWRGLGEFRFCVTVTFIKKSVSSDGGQFVNGTYSYLCSLYEAGLSYVFTTQSQHRWWGSENFFF